MATTIVTKSGSGAPTTDDLIAGELAVDLTNGRLYTEDSGGTVLELGLNPSGNVDVTGTVTANALTVNSIGGLSNVANDLTIYSTSTGHNGLRFHVDGILPTDNTGSIIDADADLGIETYRFKDCFFQG